MERLQIREISRQLAQTQHMSIGDAERFVTEMFSTICEGLKQDKQVIVNGLGTFKLSVIKDNDTITFTPDNEIARQLNAPFENFKTVEITIDIPDEEVFGYEPEKEPSISDTSLTDSAENAEENEKNETEETEAPPVEEKVDALTEKVEALTEEIEGSKKDRKKWLKIASVIALLAFVIGGGFLYNSHRIAQQEAAEKERIAALKAEQMKQKQDSINEIKKLENSVDLTDEQKKLFVGEGKADAPEYPCSKTLEQAKAILPVGAYNIGGTINVVTVREGQTLKQIAEENGLPFGEDYVQVHNALESVKEGQNIRIPSLVLK